MPWLQFGRQRWRFIDFKDQSRATSGLFPNGLVEWRRIHVTVLPFTKLARRFDGAFSFVVKPLFLYEVAYKFSLLDFLLGFFRSPFSPKKSLLFIGEGKEFEF